MTISILIIVSVGSIAGTDSTVLTDSIDSINLVAVDLAIAHLVSATVFMAADSITSIPLIASAAVDLVVDLAVVSQVPDLEVATIAHHLGVITIIITQ